jgi:energy-coupling factor transporter transmembrane protein EcfT
MMTNEPTIFTPEQLNANRAGYITSDQARMLQRGLIEYDGRMIFLVLLMFAVAAIAVVLARFPYATFLVIIPLMLGIIALLAEAQWAIVSDARRGQTSNVVGKVQILNTIRGFYLRVQNDRGHNHRLRITPQQARLLKQGLSYRIFYAPRSSIFLSAEELA